MKCGWHHYNQDHILIDVLGQGHNAILGTVDQQSKHASEEASKM